MFEDQFKFGPEHANLLLNEMTSMMCFKVIWSVLCVFLEVSVPGFITFLGPFLV